MSYQQDLYLQSTSSEALVKELPEPQENFNYSRAMNQMRKAKENYREITEKEKEEAKKKYYPSEYLP